VYAAIHVDSNSWYYIAPELPNSPSTWFLGLDGDLSAYPRTFGRLYYDNYLEYPFTFWPGGRILGDGPMVSYPNDALAPYTFGGNIAYVNSIDSVIFSSQKGLIPAVSFTTTRYMPDTSGTSHVGTNTVKPAFSKFVLYPNPATDYVNASLSFENQAGSVTYTIIDGFARVVSKETHTNVMLSDSYSYATN